MNKDQKAIDKLRSLLGKIAFIFGYKEDKLPLETSEELNKPQELADKATPKKPIKLEIIDLDEIIMPEYTNTIDKYMCDNCGLTWFIVDGHTYQHKYCKQCGQAIDWRKDE